MRFPFRLDEMPAMHADEAIAASRRVEQERHIDQRTRTVPMIYHKRLERSVRLTESQLCKER